jgi:hypothetical protein
MQHTETFLARRQERDDDKRRARIVARREWVRSPEFAEKLAREEAARAAAARKAEIAAAARLVETLDYAVKPRTLSRALDEIDEMIEDAKSDFPDVGDCDIANEMILSYVRTLRPSKRNLGLTAAILRCELSWTAAEVAEQFVVGPAS